MSYQPAALIRFLRKSKRCLLLVVFFALFVKTVSPEIQPLRVVHINVVVDEEYKRAEGWREDTSRLIASASMVYEKSFGIRLKIKDFGFWTSDNSHLSLLELLNDLQRSVFPPDSDIVLGLTGQPHLNTDLNGVASYLYGYALLRHNPSFSSMRITLLHEISHLFGAVDIFEKGSIMSSKSPDVKFDAFTERITFLNKQRRFNPYVFPLQGIILDEAEALYRERILSHPHELDNYVFLALIDLEKENYEQMITECREAMKINPQLPELHNLLGIAYRRSGKIDQAIDAYNRALDIQSDLPEVFYNLGIAYMKRGMNEEAVDKYKKAISLKPHYAQAYSNLGFLYLELGLVDFALDEVRKALNIYPELAEALTTLGAALIAKGEYGEAEAASLKALEIDPGLSGIYNNLGSISMKKNRIEEAIREYKHALEINPSYAQAHYNLGRAYLVKGKTDESVDYFQQAISLKPDYHEAFSNLAFAFFKKGKIEEALTACQKAIEIKPDYAIAFANIGFAQLHSGNFELAEEAARRAEELDPLLPEPHIIYGLLGEKKGEIEKAQQAYSQAIKLNPDCLEAHMFSANLYYMRNLWTEAATHYQKVTALDSGNGQAFNNLAVVSFRLNRLDDAFEYLGKAESLGFEVHPGFKAELLKKRKKYSF